MQLAAAAVTHTNCVPAWCWTSSFSTHLVTNVFSWITVIIPELGEKMTHIAGKVCWSIGAIYSSSSKNIKGTITGQGC